MPSVPNLSDFRVRRFLDWLCTPVQERQPRTQTELAQELGITQVMLSQWKDDADFLSEWERQYLKTIGSVARQQEILQQLYETAVDRSDPRQVVAAKTYLDVIGKARPPVTKSANRDARQLTDGQLYEILAERAALAAQQDG